MSPRKRSSIHEQKEEEEQKKLDTIDEELFNECDLTGMAGQQFTKMSNDPDFELSHFQLIKVVKLLTYQVSMVMKRQGIRFEEVKGELKEEVEKVQKKVEKEVDRVQTLVIEVQREVEGEIKGIKGQQSIKEKKMVVPPEETTTSSAIQMIGTIIPCLLEFLKIQDAINQPELLTTYRSHTLTLDQLTSMKGLILQKCDQALLSLPSSLSQDKIFKDLLDFLNLDQTKLFVPRTLNINARLNLLKCIPDQLQYHSRQLSQ